MRKKSGARPSRRGANEKKRKWISCTKSLVTKKKMRSGGACFCGVSCHLKYGRARVLKMLSGGPLGARSRSFRKWWVELQSPPSIITSVLFLFLVRSTTRGRKGCFTSTASATRLRALETLTCRATLTCTIWRLNDSVPVGGLRGIGGRSLERVGIGGGGETVFALGGEGPKTVVPTEEAREVAVVGVGGSEFSLTNDEGDAGEELVVTAAGLMMVIGLAVTGVTPFASADKGDCAALGVVIARFGGRGRCAMGPLY